MQPMGDLPRHPRVPELDGIRAYAMILVLIWHYFVGQIVAPVRHTLSAYAIAPFRTTWSGVDLFFVLSGFLIGGIVIDNRTSSNFFTTFYIRRACRILPMYFVLLVIFIVVTKFHLSDDGWVFGPDSQTSPFRFDSAFSLLSYATFTQNFLMGYHDSFGPNWLAITWSLAIEEQFYLLIPFIIVFFSRRWMLAILLCLIAISPLARWAVGGLGGYVYPFCRADSILMGVMSAVAVRHPAWRARSELWRRVLFWQMMIMLCCAAYFTWRRPDWGGVAVHFVFACLYSTFLLWVVASLGRREVRSLRFGTLRWLGERSYGIYLLHQGVSGMLHEYLLGDESPRIDGWLSASVTILSLTVTLFLADLSFRFLESVFLRLGHDFKYKGRDVAVSKPLAVLPT
jgi:peptidoglycan/LPS O-acetylase OafA/YrhL